MAQPTALEQYLLELVNRARLNPQAEASRFGIDLNAGLSPNEISSDAKQPLAFNLLLIDSARSHSQWMLDTDTFDHTGEGGSNPGDRMSKAGYKFTGSWTWGENIGYEGTTGTLNLNNAIANVHQGLFKSPGHRTNILEPNFREIGLGAITGTFDNFNTLMVTQNFAKSGSNVFLTGVAYDDLVLNDDFYTVGEGLAGIVITAIRQSDRSIFTTTTMNAGGYQIALAPGVYDISFSNNNQILSSTNQITIGLENIKLDLNTDNLNYGGATNSDDNLEGGSSNDALYGLDGNDILKGGNGDDSLYGGNGNDSLYGQNGNDYFHGGAGIDRILEFADVNFILTDTQLTGRGIDTITEVEQVRLQGGNGNNVLDAGKATQLEVTLDGAGGNDTLIGGAKSDFLMGRDGDDVLKGGNGNDSLYGGNGNDTLYGGNGTDYLFGGANNDVFALESGRGQIVVGDFQAGVDLLGLTNFLNFSDLNIVNNSQGTAVLIQDLTNNNATLATISNIDAADLSSNDFVGL